MIRVDTQFSVFLVNKPGVLAHVAEALAKSHINIVALTLVDSSEHGVLRVLCGDAAKARSVLSKSVDNFTEADVLVVEMPNEPGAFAAAAAKLGENHININYAYCSGGAPGGHTTAVFKVADLNKALKVLQPKGGKESDSRGMVKAARQR